MLNHQPEDLERDVAEERARVDAALDEVQRRLTPGQLIDEVLHHGRGAGTDFVANLGRTLAANPIPTALVGVGLMWLLLGPKPTMAITTDKEPAASDASSTGL